ncbi:MAG: hypothetical protein QW320_09795 [Ignisphaera sp.]
MDMHRFARLEDYEPLNIDKLVSLFLGNIERYNFRTEGDLHIDIKKLSPGGASVTLSYKDERRTLNIKKPVEVTVNGYGFLARYVSTLPTYLRLADVEFTIYGNVAVNAYFHSGRVSNSVSFLVHVPRY